MNKKQVSLNRQSFKTVHNLTVLMLGKCQILNSYSNCIRWIPLEWGINSIIFYRFCSLFSTQWNEGFHHPCLLRTQNTEKSFFKNLICYILLHLTFSLSQGVFCSTSNFLWQLFFYYKWNRQQAILPLNQICKFGRMKFDTWPVCCTMRFCSLSLYVFKCCFLLDAVFSLRFSSAIKGQFLTGTF